MSKTICSIVAGLALWPMVSVSMLAKYDSSTDLFVMSYETDRTSNLIMKAAASLIVGKKELSLNHLNKLLDAEFVNLDDAIKTTKAEYGKTHSQDLKSLSSAFYMTEQKPILMDLLEESLRINTIPNQCRNTLYMIYFDQLDKNSTVEDLHKNVRHYMRAPEIKRTKWNSDGTVKYPEDMFDSACAKSTDLHLRYIEEKIK